MGIGKNVSALMPSHAGHTYPFYISRTQGDQLSHPGRGSVYLTPGSQLHTR